MRTLPVATARLAAATAGAGLLAAGLLAGAAPPEAPGAVEPAVRVSARVSKTVHPGEKVVVTGRVRPAAPGRKVRLQRRDRGAWRTIDVDRLSRASRYRFVRRAPDAGTVLRLRVLKPGKRRDVSKVQVVRVVAPRAPGGPAGVGSAGGSDGAAPATGVLADVLRLANEVRAAGTSCGGTWMPPVGPLRHDARLAAAAQAHAEDMVARDYFDHATPEGALPWDRASAAGYAWTAIGENIAWGYGTAARVVEGWRTSPGHCRNMMNGDFADLGVGHATGGRMSPMWVQLFGRD